MSERLTWPNINDEVLSSVEAYLAMISFLYGYWELTKAEEIGVLLGSLMLSRDGMPMDHGMISAWSAAVRDAKEHADGRKFWLKIVAPESS